MPYLNKNLLVLKNIYYLARSNKKINKFYIYTQSVANQIFNFFLLNMTGYFTPETEMREQGTKMSREKSKHG